MCGICGIFDFTGKPVAEAGLRKMMSALRHRGPDGHGAYIQGDIALGHLRLSIIDISESGRQPMISADGSKRIIFNGEIYNYRQLRKELERDGASFRSTSDTEVLLCLYEMKGVDCLEHLEGMFAFAIWDQTKRTLFIARDRLGIKPLYYYKDARRLVFASEIKSILQDDAVPRVIDERALISYFTFGHGFAPQTVYRGIEKLLPGHYMQCTSRGIQIHKYWDVDKVEQRTHISESECSEEIRTKLEHAVTSNMVSDVPVGAFLSGGIDSSAIVAYMTRASSRPLKTFSIGFDVGGEFNELAEAELIAKKFSTEHYHRIVAGQDVENLIQKLVYHYDEPFADAANLPTYIVSALAREHVTVVLSGEGADEIFGGYRRYRAHAASNRLHRIPAMIRFQMARKLVPRHSTTRRVHKIIETLQVAEEAKRYGSWLNFFSDDDRISLVKPEVLEAAGQFDGYDIFREYIHRQPKWDIINRIMYTDLKAWLPDTYLEKIDKAAMAVSLEGRVPFLDHKLVEYAYSLPGRLKVRGRVTKYALKKALEPVLPHSTLYRPKHGFSVPLDAWFRGELKHFASDVLFDSAPKYVDYLNPGFVRELYDAHIRHERDFGAQLWGILNFELWHHTFLEPATVLPAHPQSAGATSAYNRARE
jgi:asparagine synthase (glutamine-hydrolysing)